MERLLIEHFVHAGDVCHVAWNELRNPERPILHRHDFHEVFWIEAGRGIHWINGGQRALSVGLLVLVRAADIHGFSVHPDQTLTLVNVAFRPEIWEQLWRRYRRADTDPLRKLPLAAREFQLDRRQLAELRSAVGIFQHGRRDRLTADAFLLAFFGLLRQHCDSPAKVDISVPPWVAKLRHGLGPDCFAAGTPGLARRIGKSPEHVARTLRRVLGKSPTELLNSARMDYAARQLSGTDTPIIHIAMACGLENLGHFYRLFRKAYHVSPAQYRRQQRRIVGAR